MKKWLRTICAGALLTATLASSAYAADFTDCANRLEGMKLFLGTTNHDYALDRAPTRAEAAVMLVRLLGKEAEAQSLSYSAPFTDLDNWQKPYVQYLYDNKLTTGVTETTFKPAGKCTAQMYAAFLLRTLGYDDGDFQYADAVAFATKMGLYSSITVDTENFLRDHVVAASYTALSVSPKGQDGTLLDSLVSSGAVSGTDAKTYQDMFKMYENYCKDTANMRELSAMSLEHDLSVKTDKLSISSKETIDADLKAPARRSVRSYTLTAPGAADKSISTESYLTNSTYYLFQNGIGTKRKLNDAQFKQMASDYYVVPIALVDNITISDSTYTITYTNAGLSRLENVFDTLTSAVGGISDFEAGNLTVKQFVKDGLITSQQVDMEFKSESFTGSASSVMTLKGTNDQVKLVPPSNLVNYTEIK